MNIYEVLANDLGVTGNLLGQWERVWVLGLIWFRFEFLQCDLGQISNNSEPRHLYL